MKRLISVLLSLCLILTVFSTSVFAAEKTYHTVYLNTSSATDGDGSVDTPYNSLASAINAIEASGKDAGIINIVGTLSVASSLPSYTKEITFTSTDGNGIFNYTASIEIGGPTVFKNIAIKVGTASNAWFMLRTAGHTFKFGENVTKASGSGSINVDAGDDTSGKNIDVTFLSGPINNLYVGSYSNSAITINNTNIYIGANATVANFVWGANGSGNCTFNGDVFVTASGNIASMIYTTKANKPVFNGALTIAYNNGLYKLYDISDSLTAAKGVYIMSSDNLSGSYIEATETVGVFNVIGDNEAVAVSKDGILFESSNKQLTVGEAGKYTVTYPSSDVEFLNGGAELKIKKDTTLDFETVSYIEPESKLFVGWTDEDGNAVQSGSFSAGTILTAKYINYNSDDFVMDGTEIREASDTVARQGVRFIIEKKIEFDKALKNEVSSVNYGAIYMPTDYAAGTDMEIGSKHYVLRNTVYSPKQVEAENIYARTNLAEQYTLCITDIGSELTKDKYYKFYTVKGYVQYKDINGVSRVLYTDYLTSNLYKAALEEKETNPDGYREICDTIIDYVENQRVIDLTTGSGDYAFSSWTSGPESTSGYTQEYQAIYQLNNGLSVRDIVIGTDDGSEPINIVAFSDVHFNYYNKYDELLNNPATKGQWYGVNGTTRDMGRVDKGFGSVDNANKLMEYASLYDKTVIIGDIMDYFSFGSAEIAKKLLIDRSVNNSISIALGNHEAAELFASVTTANGFRDMFTRNYKYQKLNELLWPNDIYYHSEIVTKANKKVKIVTIDNQTTKYLDTSIYTKLSADIADSKENNIPILIFQHVPINTNNSAYAQTVAFGNSGPMSTINLYNGSDYVSAASTDTNTKNVYNLITSNADIIKGIFCGHEHSNYYSEVNATNSDGTEAVIPQYTIAGSYMENGGNAFKISVY